MGECLDCQTPVRPTKQTTPPQRPLKPKQETIVSVLSVTLSGCCLLFHFKCSFFFFSRTHETATMFHYQIYRRHKSSPGRSKFHQTEEARPPSPTGLLGQTRTETIHAHRADMCCTLAVLYFYLSIACPSPYVKSS